MVIEPHVLLISTSSQERYVSIWTEIPHLFDSYCYLLVDTCMACDSTGGFAPDGVGESGDGRIRGFAPGEPFLCGF
jgi:hypothetical protein